MKRQSKKSAKRKVRREKAKYPYRAKLGKFKVKVFPVMLPSSGGYSDKYSRQIAYKIAWRKNRIATVEKYVKKCIRQGKSLKATAKKNAVLVSPTHVKIAARAFKRLTKKRVKRSPRKAK